jgi:hypothetical protein
MKGEAEGTPHRQHGVTFYKSESLCGGGAPPHTPGVTLSLHMDEHRVPKDQVEVQHASTSV